MARSQFGHIQKLKNGRYRVHWQEGSKKCSKRVDTRDDAIKYLSMVKLRDKTVDINIDYNSYYHGVIIPSYKNLSSRTKKEYIYTWEYLKPLIGKKKVSDTNWRQVQNIIDSIDAPSRQRKVFVFWRRMLAFAVRDDILVKNPCNKNIQMKRKNTKPKTLYTKEELKKILKKVENTEFALPILLECCTGIRHEEFCGLNKSDFSFKDGEFCLIEINRALTDVYGHKTLKDTKTTSSNRIVAIHWDFVNYIKAHMKYIKQKRYTCDYISPNVYTRHWLKYCTETNTKHVTFGNMRSVYATLASEAGCVDSLVSMTMGHRGGTTKERNYQKTSMMALKLNAETFAQYIKFKY